MGSFLIIYVHIHVELDIHVLCTHMMKHYETVVLKVGSPHQQHKHH